MSSGNAGSYLDFAGMPYFWNRTLMSPGLNNGSMSGTASRPICNQRRRNQGAANTPRSKRVVEA